MKKRLRKIYSKRLHLTKKSSLFDEVFQRTLEEYEGRDIEWLRKTFRSVRRDYASHPSIEIQGNLAGLRELGERAKEDE
tara:strand:+ start:243 stop:479 length:237 start_codon:yes stop_codon:yes gene_type:complete